MLKNNAVASLLLLLAVSAAPAFAADPSMHEVYEAAQSGHLQQAQQMINQVLRDHPRSAKAHYVAAELYAKQGNAPLARQELNTAQQLEPGLPFAKPESVSALQRELSQPMSMRVTREPEARSTLPWGTVLAVLAGGALLWLVFRRRNPPANGYAQYPGQYSGQYPGGVPITPGGPGVMQNPGMGSGIAGGLATGLAVGAGVVAGEEIARHFLDSGPREGYVPPASAERIDTAGNMDMGGSDFGVSDAGSWDDSGSSGGDDWS